MTERMLSLAEDLEIPVDGLDLDNIDAMIAELQAILDDDTHFGLYSPGRGDRLVALARISFLASRIAWLESVPISMEELDARSRFLAAQHSDSVRIAVRSERDFLPCSACLKAAETCNFLRVSTVRGNCCPDCNHSPA